ncbi:MFS family permease [Oikeobacillus pervagus]|uniref:MFS family permease n=1 Tax=Oikeobacillus pervagus TaxID=1325931 RepID=A0AAJ1SX90_9BACI|nr:MFS transporter [Oikeobacillus pervagus]MDQ0214450.1 MFS family permease [Oikeobacillus pervagus]
MWANRNVWIILSGELIAGLGLWMGIIGNLEFMQEKVPSDFMKSIILSIGLLAGILVGPLAGKIADQSRKKTVMIYSGLGRMLSVVFMFIAIYTGSVIWLVVFVISIQIAASFYFPALQSAIPLIVEGKDLLRMNGVHMNVATITRIIGTSLAGIMLVAMSLYMLYLFSFIAYFLLFIFTMFLKMDEEPELKDKKQEKEEAKGSFKEVFPVIKGLPIVFMTLVLSLVPMLFLGGFNLLVIKISEFHDDSLIKGMIYSVEGISFMLGAFLVKKMSNYWSPYSIMFFFSIIVGLAQISLFFVASKIVVLAAFGIVGFSVGCFFPTAATIFQTRIPKEFHGRFFSFRNMLDRVMFQVVLLGTGFLLDLVGMQFMVVIFGLISVGLTTLFYLQYRRQRSQESNEKTTSFKENLMQ